MPPILFVLIFLATFLAVEALAMLWGESRSGQRAAERRRLRQIATGIQHPGADAEYSILRARRESLRLLFSLARKLPGASSLERRLYQAGLTITPGRFVMLCIALGWGAWLVAATAMYSPAKALPFLF